MITYRMLKAKGACEGQLKLFGELFPDGAPLTVETAMSVAGKFDFRWAANNLLSEEGRQAYKEAKALLWKVYEEAEAPLSKAYQEAEAPLWKAYEEDEAALWKAYEEAEAPLFKAYKEAQAALLKAYQEAKAKLFAEIYIKESLLW